MGLAIDTVGFVATAAGATGKGATVATGDSFTIRNFPATATAQLIGLFRDDETAAAGYVQLKSPRLANDTTGIKVRALQNPSVMLLGQSAKQSLFSGDNLVVNIASAGTATKTTMGAFEVYYSTLPGSAARLHAWGDLSGAVANIFTQDVPVKTAAAGAWKDVLANSSADLMRADTTYALLGYSVSADYGVVGLRSQETGTLRICGPGSDETEDTTNWFVDSSGRLGMPYIPVVNANNRGNIKVTAMSGKATTTGKISLIWAQLSAPVS